MYSVWCVENLTGCHNFYHCPVSNFINIVATDCTAVDFGDTFPLDITSAK